MNPLFIELSLHGYDFKGKSEVFDNPGFDAISLSGYKSEYLDININTPSFLFSRGIHLQYIEGVCDFEGAPDDKRYSKRIEILQLLDNASLLGAEMILLRASSDPECDHRRVHDDLRWLAERGKQRNIRVAYVPQRESTTFFNQEKACITIASINSPYLGIAFETSQFDSAHEFEEILDVIPVRKILILIIHYDFISASERKYIDPIYLENNMRKNQHLVDNNSLFLHALLADKYTGPVGIALSNGVQNKNLNGLEIEFILSLLTQVYNCAKN